MKQLVLKVDVDTLRGTLEGVPRLLAVLAEFNAPATFLFSLGPDRTGRAIFRVFRPGFFAKVQRTSVVEHYGVRTLLYGTLLPGPEIGRRGAAVMRATQGAGHETGIHTWDHVTWQDHVRHRGAAWTARHLERSHARYRAIFGTAPTTHGAAGWQMNAHALRQLDAWGMAYASDGRGTTPYRVQVEGTALQCVQLPTTLPTLDELIGLDGRDGAGAAQYLLQQTAARQGPEVYTLHAELEGGKLLPVFRTLLAGWRDQGYTFATLGALYRTLDVATLPRAPFAWGSVPGRSGELMVQA